MVRGVRYGHLEFEYASRFAEQLVENDAFRDWVLQHTKFAARPGPKVLWEQMSARRGSSAAPWWRNHFTERCRCFGCSGHETDILAVFEDQNGDRFAVHIEVKQPTDHFQRAKRQGERYAARATCWVSNPPRAVLPHQDACTMLICSKDKLNEFADEARWFDAVITHEEIGQRFPHATVSKEPVTRGAANQFAAGQRVFHQKFGHGTIVGQEGNKLEIEFEHAGLKKVLDSFVSAG